MTRKVVPFAARVQIALQFATLSVVWALAACSDAGSGANASAGQAAGGAAANGGNLDAEAAAGDAGRGDGGALGRPDDGLSSAAGNAAIGGTSGKPSHSGGAGALAGSGAMAAGGAMGSSQSSGLLGDFCANAMDCATGLTCLPSNSSELDGEGPAHGLCTAVCANDLACAKLEAGAGCFSFGAQAYCLQACSQGDPLSIESKCRGRSDFACAPANDDQTYCLPLCHADIECGTGRYCSRASGRCTQTKPTGDPVGAACDPVATTATCLGTCVQTSEDGVIPVTGTCVELCSGALGCMYNDAGTQVGGLCAGAFSESFGLLDLGYCFPSCNCTSDCPTTFGSKCRAWTSAEAQLKTFFGKDGLCYDSTEDTVELSCK